MLNDTKKTIVFLIGGIVLAVSSFLCYYLIEPRNWIIVSILCMVDFLYLFLNAYLFLAFNPDNVIYMIVLSVCMLLASRIMWREFFTMFGLLRGDWYLFEPKLRFFHWEKFNVWVIFKPLKWIFSSPFHSSKKSFWEDFGKDYETYCYYRQYGYVD